MENMLMVGLSRQIALRRNMDVVANNLANINTNAFKSESLLFAEHMSQFASQTADNDKLSFVLNSGLSRNITEGRFETTGAPLDMAISGEGFFVVDVDGEQRYSRDGHFGLDELGQLVTRDGNAVLDENRNPILLDTAGPEVSINEDGTISAGDAQIARLAIVNFEDVRALEKAGGNLFKTEQLEEDVENPSIRQGVLEMSNVAPVLEITKMIEIMRSYQSANKLMETGAELTRKAVETLGKSK